MHNGWTIRTRTGWKQAFAYGMGGAYPPAFFSLWINQRKVHSRYEWKPGYDDNGPMLVGLVIRPASLTYCTQDYAEPEGPITCTEKPFDIGKFKIDAVEYPAKPGKKMAPGTAYVVRAPAGRQFCESELVTAQAFMQSDISAWEPGGFKSEGSKGFDGRLGWLDLDTSLPGIRGKRVVSLSSNTHYFDGDVIIIAPAATPTPEIAKRFPVSDVEKEVAQILPPGWTVIAGGQKAFYPDVPPRYVHFNAENIDGRLYFLARPTNFTKRPAATLVKPLPAGGYETACTFDAVELNY
jgi:hypothetical protein